MQIKKLSTSCTVNEANGVANDISIAYGKMMALASDSNLSAVVTEMRNGASTLNRVISQDSALSDQANKDADRDGAGRAIFYMVQGYQYNPFEPIRTAAIAVGEQLDKFGLAMFNDSYIVESSKISVLLQKLAEPSLAAQVRLLPGLEQLIADLATKESIFETSRVAYESTVANKQMVITASEAKKVLLTTINSKLVTYVRGMSAVADGMYGEFGRVIDQLIGNVNEAVKRRGSSAEQEIKSPA